MSEERNHVLNIDIAKSRIWAQVENVFYYAKEATAKNGGDEQNKKERDDIQIKIAVARNDLDQAMQMLIDSFKNS